MTRQLDSPEIAEYRELAQSIIHDQNGYWRWAYTTDPYFDDGIVFHHRDSKGVSREETTRKFLGRVVGPLQDEKLPHLVRSYQLDTLAFVVQAEIKLDKAKIYLDIAPAILGPQEVTNG